MLKDGINKSMSIRDYTHLMRRRFSIRKTRHEFNSLVSFANNLNNDLSRRDFIRLLGSKIQDDLMLRPLFNHHSNESSTWPDDFMGYKYNFIDFFDALKQGEYVGYNGDWVASLSGSIVLPWPWSPERLFDALNKIGYGKQYGCWRQDDNHDVNLFLPWGLIFVRSGNHSISSGILSGEGDLTIKRVYNMSFLYDVFDTDGTAFYYKDGTIASVSPSLWFSVIYEVSKFFSNRDPVYLWEEVWGSSNANLRIVEENKKSKRVLRVLCSMWMHRDGYCPMCRCAIDDKHEDFCMIGENLDE